MYATINIVGLALGFASFVALLHFVLGEFACDNFHKQAHNVYRVNSVTHDPTGMHIQAAGAPLHRYWPTHSCRIFRRKKPLYACDTPMYLHSRNIFERDGISTRGDYGYPIESIKNE